MVNFRKLTDKAKDAIDKRGGTESLKGDAQELRNIAKGEGSLKDKARKAGKAIKDPGARGTERSGGPGRPRYGRAEPEPGAQHGHPEADSPSTRSK
jgi:hypothetical protein